MEKLVQQSIEKLRTFARPQNWGLKLLSLLFAVFLWYFVVGEDKVDMNVSIPVEIVNLPRDLVVANQFKRQLEVTVSGQRSLIRSIAGQHISRTVDLSKATPGSVVIRNEPDSIDFPWGISVLRIQPTNLTLLLERLVQKELTIKPVVKGTPAQGFRLESITLEPARLLISGPQSVLQDETVVSTDEIDINNLNGPTSREVGLNLKPAIAELLGEPVVTARINISENTVERVIVDIPVAMDETAPAEYRPTPAVVSVRAELPLALLHEAKDLRRLFVAVVHPADLAAGPALKVNISITDRAGGLKDRVKIMDITPETVLLEIEPVRPFKIRSNEANQTTE